MQRNCLITVICMLLSGAAMASDFTYTETETVTVWERVNYDITHEDLCNQRFVSSRDVVKPVARPCPERQVAVQPVRVKTHTEVIEHYQVYQPVTIYQPMGTQIQRRVVPAKPCNKCGF
ncbi:MAG: hypothetical protein IKJ62_02545 [Alphaproteobacteria bacterium]|nr:hypothetical protein [Alphaproteobacteria bacterium]